MALLKFRGPGLLKENYVYKPWMCSYLSFVTKFIIKERFRLPTELK